MVSRTTSFTLGEHFAAFVESKISDGRYASASDVVRAGLRLLEEQETRLATLRTALMEGEASGAAAQFDFDAFVDSKRGADAPRT